MPVPRPGVLPCSRNPTRGRIACANTASVMATSTWRPRPAHELRDLEVRHDRRLPRPDLVAHAGVADVIDVVSGAIRVRPVLPVAGDRAIHEARIDRGEGGVIEAELRH